MRAYPRGVLDRQPQQQPAPITMAELTTRAYPDPAAFDTAESFSRFHHDDVAGLDAETLDRERFLARQRWANAEPSEWLRERLVHLDAEAERRRREARR
jgi:hypothetical protein